MSPAAIVLSGAAIFAVARISVRLRDGRPLARRRPVFTHDAAVSLPALPRRSSARASLSNIRQDVVRYRVEPLPSAPLHSSALPSMSQDITIGFADVQKSFASGANGYC